MNKKILRVGFFISAIAILYYSLNKGGYLPPVSYFSPFTTKYTSTLKQVVNQENLLNYQLPITEIISTPINKSQIVILIEKSQSRLTISYRDKPIKSYPVVFGSNPTGDKLQEGDLKTPEGTLRIRDLYPHKQWSKFIWLDYPNRESWQKHLQAKKAGTIPVSASIGSEIGIHGVNKGSDYLIEEQNNWTWGCISLKNKDVDEIYSIVEVGTVVQIVP